MLIIGRKKDQKIVISDNIEITILEIGRNRVRFGVQAPREVKINTKLKSLPPQPGPEKPDAEPEKTDDFRVEVVQAQPFAAHATGVPVRSNNGSSAGDKS